MAIVNFEPALRQAAAAQIAIDAGCYLVAYCLVENAAQEVSRVLAEEAVRLVVEEQMKPGGLLHAFMNGQRQGGSCRIE